MSHAATQPAPNVARQLRHTTSQVGRILNWSLQPDSLLRITNHSVSKWTPAQHIEHTNRANGALLSALRKLVESPEPHVVLPFNDKAHAFIAGGVIERGKYPAPPSLELSGMPLDEIRADSQALFVGYKSLDAHLDKLASHRTADHPALGPLTGEQWLRFCEIHTFHHLKILCEIVGANL